MSGRLENIQMKVWFIVSGEDVPIEAEPELPFAWAARRALRVSHNFGRPANYWEIRNEDGVLLDGDSPVSIVPDWQRVFLTVRIGAGGAAA